MHLLELIVISLVFFTAQPCLSFNFLPGFRRNLIFRPPISVERFRYPLPPRPSRLIQEQGPQGPPKNPYPNPTPTVGPTVPSNYNVTLTSTSTSNPWSPMTSTVGGGGGPYSSSTTYRPSTSTSKPWTPSVSYGPSSTPFSSCKPISSSNPGQGGRGNSRWSRPFTQYLNNCWTSSKCCNYCRGLGYEKWTLYSCKKCQCECEDNDNIGGNVDDEKGPPKPEPIQDEVVTPKYQYPYRIPFRPFFNVLP